MSDDIVAAERLTAWQRWELASFEAQPRAEAPPQAATRLPTAEEVERIHREAHKLGYDAGYEEGTARARMEALRLHTLVEQLDAALGELDQRIAEALLALAVEIARQVVRQTIALRPAVVLDVLRDALAQLPHREAVLFLHPEDAALLRARLGEQLDHLGHRLVEDPAIARGGLRLEAGGSELDASVEGRWRRVLEAIGAGSAAWIEPPP